MNIDMLGDIYEEFVSSKRILHEKRSKNNAEPEIEEYKKS